MATTRTEPGEIVAAWVPTSLADQVKAAAEDERRSVSSLVRNALADTFAETRGDGTGTGDGPAPDGGLPSLPPAAAPGRGQR
jgi:hypothetical protein